ncbi:hypothetical protein ACIRRA_01845 [Nocardia sp. NPDC101769]|uniref:hypothetical protein n=1 Tax=Nocardia sp. NPDC101769 TaxID=3364333 RepID=UPI0038003E5D
MTVQPAGPSTTTVNAQGQTVTTTPLTDGTDMVVTTTNGPNGPTTTVTTQFDPALVAAFRNPADRDKPLPSPDQSLSPQQRADKNRVENMIANGIPLPDDPNTVAEQTNQANRRPPVGSAQDIIAGIHAGTPAPGQTQTLPSDTTVTNTGDVTLPNGLQGPGIVLGYPDGTSSANTPTLSDARLAGFFTTGPDYTVEQRDRDYALVNGRL